MTEVKSTHEKANTYADALEKGAHLKWEILSDIDYSNSPAVSGLKEVLSLSKSSINSFAKLAQQDAANIRKTGQSWQQFDNTLSQGFTK
ncbi:TIGR04197 family type VII secretion effector [Listeria grayi]|uniref:TIGR04197 family type VII secretion effector n=1 Tax=Listeria grayi TaxID=1641 RepID=UPI0016250FE9|nr:TIGR04197 family type VII secretion effector [Listeria grayi]MBC1921991.1 TIGR04197 family type VII secretion effector [Listeria grayi]